VQGIHLRPRSLPHQRTWYVDGGQSIPSFSSASRIILAVQPDNHRSFSSLRSILKQLKPFAASDQLSNFRRIEVYLQEACTDGSEEGTESRYGQLMTDAVTFAIMRRISRESVYTARLIDLSSGTINAVLASIPKCRYAHVIEVDRLDRPTLKVLARAMLLLEPGQPFSWVWHSSSDPLADLHSEDPFLNSRHEFLRQLLAICSPRLNRSETGGFLPRPKPSESGVSLQTISAALVVQNYDACFLWCPPFTESYDDVLRTEGLRLLALAAINVGQFSQARSALRLAEEGCGRPGRRAHLCYLHGLMEAKRRYDMSTSASHYNRGLSILDEVHSIEDSHGEDLPLERAWLFNGLALNEAIQWRQHPPCEAVRSRAFDMVHAAFNLVREGSDPSRVYLRFNLVANAAFLIEMEGQYNLAIDILARTFEYRMGGSETAQKSLRGAMDYRVGVLKLRAGVLDEAHQRLEQAAQEENDAENGATYEHILRALGTVALKRRAFADARYFFKTGLDLCLSARAAEGAREHGRGLVAAFLLKGERSKAEELVSFLKAEEGLTVMDPRTLDHLGDNAIPLSLPAPKLPAYIPEIDLEDIPKIDINRFLSNTPSRDASGNLHWAS
jgi:tetratricopeptide (TPR) repeat protein